MSYVDSHLRCPYDGKRMMLDLGPNDDGSGCEQIHECWECGYRERDDQWRQMPVLELVRGRLKEQRSGKEHGVEVSTFDGETFKPGGSP